MDLGAPASTSIQGQTHIVIGAGSGIGRATATHFGQLGANVVCVDRDEAAAGQTAGVDGMALFGDVTDFGSLQRVVETVVERYGQIHGVVNSAGIQGPVGRRSHEVELDEFDAAYEVNLKGALAVSKAVIPHMMEHHYGRLAFVASIAGKEGNPNMIGYSATKAGLIGLVKAQGKEYAEDGITINALAPAVIQTPFLDTQPAAVTDYMTAKIPMRRTGTTTECAQMLAWMVSPACSFTTGFTFDLTGGRATY